MFDKYIVHKRTAQNVINDIKVNSVSGTITKSIPGSIITKVVPGSKLEEQLFNISNPHYVITEKEFKMVTADEAFGYGGGIDAKFPRTYTTTKNIPIEVVQVMLCGDFLMVEFILLEV